MLDPYLGQIARQQHGVLAWSQAAERGVTRGHWDSARRAKIIESVAPGVCRFSGSPVTELQRVMTAVLSAGPTAFASHRTAARLWGLDAATWRPIDVTVTTRSRLAPRDGIVIHRPSTVPRLRLTRRFGIPTAPPIAVLHQLGAVAPEIVPSALEHFMIAELVTIRAVKASLIQSSTVGRPGVGALRCALDSWMFGDRPPDSVLEVRVARHLADYGMTQWEPQLRIGRYRVDFAHRPTQTILEVDGWAFHRQRQAFDADRQRDAALAALGWLVIRITWQQINDDPDATFARVGAVLNARTRRAG